MRRSNWAWLRPSSDGAGAVGCTLRTHSLHSRPAFISNTSPLAFDRRACLLDCIDYLATMPVYRFYPLTDESQTRPIETTFFNDRAATSWAFGRAGSAGIEVWQGARFVARLHGTDHGAVQPQIEDPAQTELAATKRARSSV